MANELSAVFESPSAGWLPFALSAGASSASIQASYTPNDFLAELVNALAAATQYEGSFIATAHEEPNIKTVAFERAGIVLRVAVRENNAAESLFSFSGSVSEVVLPIWRSLRRLQTHENFQEWRHPFPDAEMRELSRAVDRIKSSAA